MKAWSQFTHWSPNEPTAAKGWATSFCGEIINFLFRRTVNFCPESCNYMRCSQSNFSPLYQVAVSQIYFDRYDSHRVSESVSNQPSIIVSLLSLTSGGWRQEHAIVWEIMYLSLWVACIFTLSLWWMARSYDKLILDWKWK